MMVLTPLHFVANPFSIGFLTQSIAWSQNILLYFVKVLTPLYFFGKCILYCISDLINRLVAEHSAVICEGFDTIVFRGQCIFYWISHPMNGLVTGHSAVFCEGFDTIAFL